MTPRELRLKIDEYAALLEIRLSDYLIPTEPGIYIAGQDKPAMTPDTKKYYGLTNHKNKQIEQYNVTSISDINGAVYDENLDTVIPSSIGYNHSKLSLYPTIPIRGRGIIEAYVKDFIANQERFSETGADKELTQAHEIFINGLFFEPFQDIVIDVCFDLREKISPFVPFKTSDIFTVHQENDTLIISNEGDFRVLDWENKFGDDYEKRKSGVE